MFCGHCGAENDNQTKFCISCGKLLAEQSGSPQPDPQHFQAPPPHSIPPPPQAPPIAPGTVPPSFGSYEQIPNTSGMGSGHPLPPETQNMNLGGCLPCGIFAFANGAAMWGIIVLVASCFVGSLANLVLLIKGNEFAWQNRRFNSRQEYNETMNAWNYWGKIYLIFSIIMSVIGAILYVALIVFAISMEGSGGNF